MRGSYRTGWFQSSPLLSQSCLPSPSVHEIFACESMWTHSRLTARHVSRLHLRVPCTLMSAHRWREEGSWSMNITGYQTPAYTHTHTHNMLASSIVRAAAGSSKGKVSTSKLVQQLTTGAGATRLVPHVKSLRLDVYPKPRGKGER